MIYLIDGHNLLPKFKKIRNQIHRDHLYVRDFIITQLITHFKSRPTTTIVLYFDNKVQTSNLRQKVRGVSVVYAKPGFTADDMIKKDVRDQKYKSDRIVVVSDDRGITNVVRGGNVYIKSASEFYKAMHSHEITVDKKDKKPDVSLLSDSEVDNWMELFGSDDEGETE